MPNDDRTKVIYRGTPESAAMLANVKRAMAITATLNRLTFKDADEIRALFSELIGKKVDERFLLIPPFYAAGGDEIRVGRNVFVNLNCTFYDLGGLDIADDVMIGPSVRIITTGQNWIVQIILTFQPAEERIERHARLASESVSPGYNTHIQRPSHYRTQEIKSPLQVSRTARCLEWGTLTRVRHFEC